LGQSQILAVVVRYKTPIAESQTLQGLAHILAADPVLADVYRVLVWDNSPEALVNPELPRSFEYRHSEQNLGVSGAYNSAMAFAEAEGQTWMLLLDQDSKLTGAFLHTMYRHSQVLKDRTDIAVIFPTVKVGQTIMSPKRQLFMRATVYEPMSRMLEGYAIGINSGSVMRVTSLRKIGGFSTDFWLDYSDLYVLHQFHLNGARIWYAADAAMQHEMTIMDYDRLMEPWRYENFSFAETAFHDLYKPTAFGENNSPAAPLQESRLLPDRMGAASVPPARTEKAPPGPVETTRAKAYRPQQLSPDLSIPVTLNVEFRN
jgi:hypothetical protein